jgi:hypothetical protein
VIITSIAALFRDDLHALVGLKFVSLSPRAKPIKNLYHLKYSFTNPGYINPAILDELRGWQSDSGNQVVAINLTDSNSSNRYFGEVNATPHHSENPIITFTHNETTVSYQYIGCSLTGVHIVKLVSNYGGSGWFHSLLLLTIAEDIGVNGLPDKLKRNERLSIKIVGSIALGDRYQGEIRYKFGILFISACGGAKTLVSKKQKLLVL